MLNVRLPAGPDGNDGDLAAKTAKNRTADRRVLFFTHIFGAVFLTLLCLYGEKASYDRFGVQLLVIIALVFVSARLLYAGSRTSQRAIVFYFRCVFVVIARLMIDESDPIIALLLLLPFVGDCLTCFGPKLSLIFASAMTSFFIAFDFAARPGDGYPMLLFRAALETALVFVCAFYYRRIMDYAELLDKTINDRANLTQAIDKLTSVNTGYQEFTEKVTQKSAEDERNRITREIHDVVGYALINVKMLMNVGKVYLETNSGDLRSVFDAAGAQVDSALQETRQILYAQRSRKEKSQTWLESINALAKTFREVADVEVEINYGNLPSTLDERITKAVYRMIQEGLVNAFKHGKADKVWISLWRANKEFVVNIRDNGSGAGMSGDGIGLSGMRERLSELGGSLDARKVVDGYVLDARIPAAARKEASHGA